MIEAVLMVLTKAVAGRDYEFNDWYTNIHIRDALRFRGSLSAQRFRLSADQIKPLPDNFDARYLALYDVFDAERLSREHWESALTSRMMISNAMDDSLLDTFYYYPLQFRSHDPEVPHTGGVIVEHLNPAPGCESAFRDWYNDEYLPAAMRRPGVHSAAALMFRKYGQMIPLAPNYRYVGIYRVNDAREAVAAWRQSEMLGTSTLVDQASARITHWEAINSKITKDAVTNTSAAALAEEERARIRMGDKIVTGGKEKLGPA